MSGRVLASLTMTVVFALFVAQAFLIRREAAVMPFLIGVPALVLSLSQLLVEMRKAASTSEEPIFLPRERSTAIWLLGFVLGVIAFGFAVGAPLLVVGYLMFAVGLRWPAALIGGGLCLAAMYALDKLLNIPLFEGLIIRYLF